MFLQAYNRRALNKFKVSELKEIKKMLRISRASIYSDQSKKDELINQILDAIKHMYQMGKLWVQVTENNNDFIEKLNEKN